MTTKPSQAKFNLAFKDLLVWADTSKFSKCCKSKPKTTSIKSKTLTISQKDESSDGLMQSLLEEKDDKVGNSHFNEIKNSGIESLHKKLPDPELRNILNKPPDFQDSESFHGKAILKNIEGVIYSDEMVAVLGPSGSGKTTFLNFISSRSNWDKNLYVDGNMYLNNFKIRHLSRYKHLIGFVPQEDILYEDLTVRQNLENYGRLRGLKNYKEKATKIIQDLELEKCQNTVVGGQLERGVSGGEKKRTCIGIEMMSEPKILFLDEPTTGIDAYTALEVVKNLKKLNQQDGLGVVTVIHQPRQEIIDNFDRVSTIC